jgi:hypothetical protein
MRLSSLLPLILALTATAANAAMFKWTDQHGKTQYGQHPPPGVEAERIIEERTPESAGQPTQSPQERLKESEEKANLQSEREKAAAEDKQWQETRKQNCENARKSVQVLQNAGNRRFQLPDGTITRLSAEEVQRRLEESRGHVKKYCD